MIKCLLSRPGLIAGPLHSTPLQNNSQSIPRIDHIDSKSSFYSKHQPSIFPLLAKNFVLPEHGEEDEGDAHKDDEEGRGCLLHPAGHRLHRRRHGWDGPEICTGVQ